MSYEKELVKAIRRAVSRIDRDGLDVESAHSEVAAVLAFESGIEEALREAVAAAAPERLAATIRLVRRARARGLANEIASLALRRPVPLDAKVEAVGLLRDVGVEIPKEVEDTLGVAREFVDAPDSDGLRVVLSLPEAWQAPVLSAWLARPVSDPHLLESVLGFDPGMDEVIVDRLGASGTQEAVSALQRIVAGDGRLRKAAKRALHRLHAAGVAVAEKTSAGEGFSLQIAPDTERESRAFTTGIDGSGGRILWVMAPSSKGGFRLLEAVVDDERGLRKSEVMSVALKGFRSHIERLRANPAILVAQIDAARAVAILRAGEALAAEAGDPLPAEYTAWRDDIAAGLFATEGKPQDGRRDPDSTSEESATGAVPEDADAPTSEQRELLAQTADLLGEPYFASWAVLGEAVEGAAAGVRRAETSTLVVDEEQRKQQVDREISGVAEIFDSTTRACYRQRLEHMAEVLRTTKHDGQARLALVAARGFTDVADLYSDHPFARALIQRGVLAAYQSVRQEEDRESSESRIVQP